MRTHTELLLQLTRRDIAARYRGTSLGILWSFVTPLLMLTIYTFVFTVVFAARWPGAEQGASRGEYALLLFAGLLVHGLAAECLLKAPGLIPANVNFVKKVVFPLPLLPVVTLSTALFHTLIGLVVLLAGSVVVHQSIPVTALWLPVVLLPYAIGLLGCVWGLAALGVYLRDIGQLVGLGLTALLFLSPVFYPPQALPEAWRPFLYANPLTLMIEQVRAVLIYGAMPDFVGLAVYSVAAVAVCAVGYAFFQKTRHGFADVL